MAGYYDDEEYGPAPHRPGAAQFDTMNLGPGPQRVEQFNTANLGPAPYRAAQFDTVNLAPPVRAQEPPKTKAEKPIAGDGLAYDYTDSTPHRGETPMNPAFQTQSAGAGGGGRLLRTGLVVAILCLRAAAAVSLVIALAILASASQTIDVIISDVNLFVTVTFSSWSSTKYALAAAIIGAVYSLYETISAAVRLAMKHPLLPGNSSLFISYIGDQVVIVLLLSGASAAAATLRDLHVLQPNLDGATYCDYITHWCNQATGGVGMMFLGFCFVAASFVISSYCFYTGRS